jgi:hypothetical protein
MMKIISPILWAGKDDWVFLQLKFLKAIPG